MIRVIFLILLALCSTLTAAPRVVVFDFGGVMTTESNRQAVVHLICQTFGFSKDEFEKVNAEKKLALQSGKTDEQYWREYADSRGIALPDNWSQQLDAVMLEAIGVNAEMYALVADLKAQNIQTALLSNIDARLARLLRQFDLYEPFHPCLLSCEIGVEKPYSGAYEILLEQLSLPATDVVFIDDKWENVLAAKQVGIDALVFESPQQVRLALNERGIKMNESTPEFLYKVISPEDWQASQHSQQVVPSAMDKGFIHLATQEQVGHVAEKFWKNKKHLVLKLAVAKLKGDLVLETNPGGSTHYYHLYNGTIPLDAVVGIQPYD